MKSLLRGNKQELINSQPDVSLADLINDFFVGISAGLPSIDLSVLSDLNDDYTALMTLSLTPPRLTSAFRELKYTKLLARTVFLTGFSVISVHSYVSQ